MLALCMLSTDIVQFGQLGPLVLLNVVKILSVMSILHVLTASFDDVLVFNKAHIERHSEAIVLGKLSNIKLLLVCFFMLRTLVPLLNIGY